MQLWRPGAGKMDRADIPPSCILLSAGCRPVSYDWGETEIFSKAAAAGRMVKKLNGFSIKRLKEKASIGIVGIGTGCGATHLTIALANYMQSALGKKTAVIELSGQQELKDLIKKEGGKKQKLLGVSYYTDGCGTNVPDIMNSTYEAVILDLGADYMAAREEFLRCDRKIVVGSISPWKVIAYERFLNHITATENYEAWEFLVLFANMLDKKTIQKRYGMHLLSIPWIENPFYLKQEDLIFLQRII